MMSLSFVVYGTPATAGSKRGVPIYRGKKGARVFTGKVAVVEDCERAKPWRLEVQWTARAAMANAGGLRPFEGPLVCHAVFVMPRPRSHYGKRGLRPSAPLFPTTRPDEGKLARHLHDALKGVVWRDDAQVVAHHGWKIYGEDPGVRVIVRPATEADMPTSAQLEAAA